MTLLRSFILGLLMLIAASAAADNRAAAELDRLGPYLDGTSPAGELRLLPDDSCAAKVVKLGVLYASSPDRYRNDFFAMLVIDDYAERDRGRYNVVGPDDVKAVLAAELEAFADLGDRRFEPVIAYCGVRDRNLWVDTRKEGRISIARLMRGAMLQLLLGRTAEDPLAIATAVDRHTALQFERNK